MENDLVDALAPGSEDADFLFPTNDSEFDRVFSERVRKLSGCHWTPMEICEQAAHWLVTKPGTRVLDVGCGPGKFCAIGAVRTTGHFTGVEQRGHLCGTAKAMLKHYGIPRVQILHTNVIEVEFRRFDAFYIFNPFEENMFPSLKIDGGVELKMELFSHYTRYVHSELSRLRNGTRVVTYWGDCDEIPRCYECVETAFEGQLRLWVKRRSPRVKQADQDDSIRIYGNRVDINSLTFPTINL
jgi:SAM-dependent methyltransferase